MFCLRFLINCFLCFFIFGSKINCYLFIQKKNIYVQNACINLIISLKSLLCTKFHNVFLLSINTSFYSIFNCCSVSIRSQKCHWKFKLGHQVKKIFNEILRDFVKRHKITSLAITTHRTIVRKKNL